MEPFIVHFSASSSHFFPLRSEHSPQHPLTKIPHTYFPTCKKPSFTWKCVWKHFEVYRKHE
jgi:hypothetical protein